MTIKRGQISRELETAARKKLHVTLVNNSHQRNTEKIKQIIFKGPK